MKIYSYIKKIIKENKSAVQLPNLWYHGTNELFDKFDITHKGKNFEQSVLGIYFTQYLKPPPFGSTAKEYADEAVKNHGGKPYIYECKLEINKPLILDSNGWYSTNVFIDKNRSDIINWLKNDDYDSIVAYDFDIEDIDERDYICVIFNTEQINIIKTLEL